MTKGVDIEIVSEMDVGECGEEKGDGDMTMSEEEAREGSEQEFVPQSSTSTAASAAPDAVQTEEHVFVKPETPSVKFILNTPYLTSRQSVVMKRLYTMFRTIAQLAPAVASLLRTLSSGQDQSSSLSGTEVSEQFLDVVQQMFKMHNKVIFRPRKPSQLPKTSKPQNNTEDKGGNDRHGDEMKKGKEEKGKETVTKRGTAHFSDITPKASQQWLQKDIAGFRRSEDNETEEPPEADSIQTKVDSQDNTQMPEHQLHSDPANLSSQKSEDIGTLTCTSTPSNDVCTTSCIEVSDFQLQNNNPDRCIEGRKEKELLECKSTQKNIGKHARKFLQQQNKNSSASRLSKDFKEKELSGAESSAKYHAFKNKPQCSDHQQHEDATYSRSQDTKENLPPASESTEGRDDKGMSVAEPSPRPKRPWAEPKPEPQILPFEQLCGELFVASGCCASLGTFLHTKMCCLPLQTRSDTLWVEDCTEKCLKILCGYVGCCDPVISCLLRHKGMMSALVKPVNWFEFDADKELTAHEEEILQLCLTMLYCLTSRPPALRELRGLNLIPRVLRFCESSRPFFRRMSMLLVSVLLTEEEARGMELTEPQIMSVLEPVPGLSLCVSGLSWQVAVAVRKFSMNDRNRQALLTKYAEKIINPTHSSNSSKT